MPKFTMREVELICEDILAAARFQRECEREVRETLAWLATRREQTLREAVRKVGV